MCIDTDRHLANAESRAENDLEDVIDAGLIAVQEAHDKWLTAHLEQLCSLCASYDTDMIDAWRDATNHLTTDPDFCMYDYIDSIADPLESVRDAVNQMAKNKKRITT